MGKYIEIDVNHLKEAIEQYRGVKIDIIEKVDIADIKDQHHPKQMNIGIGGVLTVYCTEDTYRGYDNE